MQKVKQVNSEYGSITEYSKQNSSTTLHSKQCGSNLNANTKSSGHFVTTLVHKCCFIKSNQAFVS